jgi:D-glycero-D-manno-heptose 1,7-bisphosphate phosphatase
MNGRRAAFLDRDGTIIEDVNHISRPEQVALRPGAAEGIALLNANDVVVVVITNQSGLARGLFTVADYEAVRDRVDVMLARYGARIDASYYCPHYPSVSGPCDCRKPGRKLFDEAIATLGLDASRSMFAGDRSRDVAPAQLYGGRAYLIPATSTPTSDLAEAPALGAAVVPSLLDAAEQFLALPPVSRTRVTSDA